MEKGVVESNFTGRNIPIMKTTVTIAIFILCLWQPSQAQKDSLVLNKFYHTWIIPEKGERGISGILYEIKDSSVLVSNSPWRENYTNGNFDVTKIDIRHIREIRVRRQGAGFSILVGGLSGMIVGGIISAVYIDHLKETMNPIGFAFGGAILGVLPFIVSTGIGFGVGGMVSPKLKIPIGGSQDKYDRKKIKLNEYALKTNSYPELFHGKSLSKFRDTVVDIDGNVYKTLVLGGQVWMGENLRVTRYRDGSKISNYTSDYYNNGNRYRWFVVNDDRKLCPEGWHVPSLTEWTSLFNSLGGEESAGRRLEESFSTNGPVAQWWSSTGMDANSAQSFYLNNKTFGVMFTGAPKSSGLSVRCIRDNK